MAEEYVEVSKSRWNELWKKDDWWAVWLGFALLIIGVVVYFPRGPADLEKKAADAEAILAAETENAPLKTIAWFNAHDSIMKLKATDSSAGESIKDFTTKPHKWKVNPLRAFYLSKDAADKRKTWTEKETKIKEKKTLEKKALAAARTAESEAAAAGFKDAALNRSACGAIKEWRNARRTTKSAAKKARYKPFLQVHYLIGMMAALAIFFGIGIKVMGQSFLKFILGFMFIFLIAVLAYTASSQVDMKKLGIGYAAWAILFGLIFRTRSARRNG